MSLKILITINIVTNQVYNEEESKENDIELTNL